MSLAAFKLELLRERNQEKISKNLLDILKDKETDKELIEEYVSDWIGCDNYYKYHILDVVLDVVYDENGKAECIALATMY